MVIPNLAIRLNNSEIFKNYFAILDVSSAHACGVLSVKEIKQKSICQPVSVTLLMTKYYNPDCDHQFGNKINWFGGNTSMV